MPSLTVFWKPSVRVSLVFIVVLVVPLLLFRLFESELSVQARLFVGIFDLGFYAHEGLTMRNFDKIVCSHPKLLPSAVFVGIFFISFSVPMWDDCNRENAI